MGWRRANRIRPPIGTQLRLGQPALERAQTQPQHLGRRMLAGASLALRATMQRIAAALATRSIGLVDVAPVGIELLQYQQSCRLGQGLVFTTQLLL